MRMLRARLGLLIGTGFGALWATWAAALLSLGRIASVGIAATAALLIVAALSMPVTARRRARPASMSRRTWLWYGLIVLGEIVALNLILRVIGNHGAQDYARPAIGLIVGLHFFPLGWAMRVPGFYWLGTAMTAAALVTIAAIAWGGSVDLAAGIDCAVNALLLWTSVALALAPRLHRERDT